MAIGRGRGERARIEELLASVADAAPPDEPPTAPRPIPPVGALLWLNRVFHAGGLLAFTLALTAVVPAAVAAVGVAMLAEAPSTGLALLACGGALTAAMLWPFVGTVRALRRTYREGHALVGVIVGATAVELEASTEHRAWYAYRSGGAVRTGSFYCPADALPDVGTALWVLVHPERDGVSVDWPR